MDGYALPLALAALAGASVVAVSAYYIHRRTLSDLIDFALAAIDRDPPDDDADDHRRRPRPDPRSNSRSRSRPRSRSAASLHDLSPSLPEPDRRLSCLAEGRLLLFAVYTRIVVDGGYRDYCFCFVIDCFFSSAACSKIYIAAEMWICGMHACMTGLID